MVNQIINKRFFIYGAGIVATTIYTALKELCSCVPEAFIVTNAKANPKEIDGIGVIALSELDVSDDTCIYFIATPEVHHASIVDSLLQVGIVEQQLVLVNNDLESKLLEAFYGSSKEFATFRRVLETATGKTSKNPSLDITMLQAKSHVDKPLKGTYTIPEYIQPIQVGAALTDNVIADIRDDIGSNISAKNRNYCELTATYHAWKHCKAKYKGLCHYRRIFDISQEQLNVVLTENPDVDVILPYPTVFYPDIKKQHAYCINDTDWNAMLQALQEVAPDYYATFEDVFSDQYFYNYNMLIAKEEVFDDYSHFMFSVLERVEELTTPKGWERADRFAGYIGENLTTLYFRKNRDRLKIVHAGKKMLT